jgi:hypothetical protein
MLPKMTATDPSKIQEKRQREKEGEGDDGEASTSSADSGEEDKPPPPPPSSELAKPRDVDTKKSPLAAAKLPLSATAHPAALQKLSTEGGVSKTISPIVKPAAAAVTALNEAASKDQDALAGGAVKTKKEGVPKDEEKVAKKPSPPPVLQGSTTEAKAVVQQDQTTAASKPKVEPDVGGGREDGHAQKLAGTATAPLTVAATTTATATVPVPLQPPQSTAATAATSDKDKPLPQTTNLTGDSKQAPPPTAAPKEGDSVSIATTKAQDDAPITAAKVGGGDTGGTLAGDEGKEKQPVLEKPAEASSNIGGISRHVSFGGVEQFGGQQLQLHQQQSQQQSQQQQQPQQPQPVKSGSAAAVAGQGLTLNTSDLDIEADMEGDGDMEGRLMLRGTCGT